jgi:hypothetical protein
VLGGRIGEEEEGNDDGDEGIEEGGRGDGRIGEGGTEGMMENGMVR